MKIDVIVEIDVEQLQMIYFSSLVQKFQLQKIK